MRPRLAIVGSGAAGLVAAINAHRLGLDPIVVEKAAVWGGTTAISGGVLWAPGNGVMAAEGAPDDPEGARAYVHRLLGPDAPREARAKADAFIDTVPEVIAMLGDAGVRWVRDPGHPDYYPHVEGAGTGRGLGVRVFDGRTLGAHFDTMRGRDIPLPGFDTRSSGRLMRVYTRPGPFLHGAGVVLRDRLRRARGQAPLGLGRALAASLMARVIAAGIAVRLGAPMTALIVENGAVRGLVLADGERLDAPAGVVLAAGGFARNPALRRHWQGDDGSWSSAIPEDHGNAIEAALALGASIQFGESAWWMPSLVTGAGMPAITLGERALPGSLIVDGSGRRFMDEAQSYMACGHAMKDRDPMWLVFDARFVRRYVLRVLSSRMAREGMKAAGTLVEGSTLTALAKAAGLPVGALTDTVSRFNGFAASGVDADFRRGESVYDRFWADPANRPNPSLAPLVRPPYYAARLRLGDLGTAGGLRTDASARVLGQGDAPIPGLYAAGNSAASPFGYTYPGGGATIAAAATFGFIASAHAAATAGTA